MVECLLCMQNAGGSIPSASSSFLSQLTLRIYLFVNDIFGGALKF